VYDLKVGSVVHHVTADAPEAPSDERGGFHDDGGRRRNGHGERRDLRHQLLQPFLGRPYQGDDQEGERQRRENRARDVKRGKADNGRTHADRDAERSTACRPCFITGIAQRRPSWGTQAMPGCTSEAVRRNVALWGRTAESDTKMTFLS